MNELSVKDVKIIKGKVEGKTDAQIGAEVYPNATPASARTLVQRRLQKVALKDAVKAELMRDGLTLADIMAPVKKALKATTKHRSYQKETIKDGRKTIEKTKEVIVSEEDNIPLQLQGHDRAIKLLGIDKMHEEETTGTPLTDEEIKALAEESDEVELTRLVFKKNSL